MARKSYSEEFKRYAVALYRDTEGATLTAIAADLGITDATLSSWCRAGGVPICGSPEIVEGFLCRFRLGLGFPDLVVDG